MPRHWLTTAEAATHLRVTRNTLYRWRSSSGLPCRVVGGSVRFLESELDEWMDEHREAALVRPARWRRSA